jgi:hypothetical protein
MDQTTLQTQIKETDSGWMVVATIYEDGQRISEKSTLVDTIGVASEIARFVRRVGADEFGMEVFGQDSDYETTS